MKALRIPLRVMLLLFLVMVISGGFIYWVGTRTGILEQQVNAWLDSFLSAQLPLAVTLEDIGGEPWHHLIITGIQVDEISGDSLIPILTIDTLEIHYDWRNLVSGTWIFQKAALAGVRGHLRADSLGQPHLAWQVPGEPSRPPFTLPEIEVEELTLRRLEFVMTGTDTIRIDLYNAIGSVQMLPGRIDQEISLNALVIQGPRSVSIDSAHAHILVMHNEWFINDLFVSTDSTTLTGSARITTDRETEVFANVSLSPGRWNDLSMWADIDLPGSGNLEVELQYASGALQGRGTLRGNIFGRRLDGLGWSLKYDQGKIVFDTLFGRALGSTLNGKAYLDLSARPIEYGATVTVEGFNLQELVSGDFTSDISGDLKLEGRGTQSSDLAVNIHTPGARGSLNQFVIDTMSGTISVSSQAIDIEDGFYASYLGMSTSLSGRVEFDGDMVIDGTVDIAHITRVMDFLGYSGSDGASRGSFSLRSSSADPTLSFDMRVDSLRYKNATASRAHVAGQLAHAFTGAKGKLTGRFYRSNLWGADVDSAHVALSVDPQLVTVDPIRIYRGTDSVTVVARFSPASGSLTVDRFNADVLDRQFKLAWPAELRFKRDTLWIHNISLQQGEGTLTVNGWIEYDGALQIKTTIGNAAVGTWTALESRADEFDGTLFADVEITGYLDAPRAAYKLRLIDFTYGQFALGVFTAQGSLSTDELRIDSISLHTDDEEYFGFAQIPLQVDGKVWRVDNEGLFNARVSLSGTKMRLIRLLLPDVESLSGQVNATAQISGSLGNPTLKGQFELHGGNLKVWQLRDPLTELDVSVLFHDSVATIVTLRAEVHNLEDDKQSGEISGSGTMTFRELSSLAYDIKLIGQNVPARYEFGDFTGLFDFDISLTGAEPPTVAGDVLVREAYYRDPFEKVDSLAQAVAQASLDTNAWIINLEVNIPKNAWTKNREVNAEWSGNLRVLRERGDWNYLGRLESLRGTYTFVGRRFRNLRGDILFDDVHRVDPQLNLEADINLPYSGRQNGSIRSSSLREITVRVEGRLSNPRIIPPAWLGEHNLIQALTVGATEDGGGLDVGESAKLGAAGLLANELEIIGGGFLQPLNIGVEIFEPRPSETGSYDPFDTRLRISKHLHPDILVYGASRVDFNLAKGTELGFEYRLKNWLSLQGNRDFDNLYNFDLNLKLRMDK